MWIKTSEKLPDDDMTVLLALDDGEVWPGYRDAGIWRYVTGDPLESSRVTYWMDLPPHPEQG
jgi:hypothetical protein